jgi:hypothetical protein
MDRRLRLTALATIALHVLAGGSVSAAHAAPTTAPAPIVWLKGAFGTVAGGEPPDPATAAPDARPLDTWMRRAPLELQVDIPDADVLALSVVTRAPDGVRVDGSLSEGATSFEGPDRPGRHVLTATVESRPYGRSVHAWLLEVPDREGGPELLWDIPGPSALVSSSTAEVTGSPGHGCYAYLCVEAGYRPPPDTLAPLAIGVGETPALRLDDGSAMVHWRGWLRPLPDTIAESRHAEDTFEDRPVALARLAGLEPTIAGQWSLELRADYDRSRGWQWFIYRLVAE